MSVTVFSVIPISMLLKILSLSLLLVSSVFAGLPPKDLAPKSDAPPILWDGDFESGLDIWTKEIGFPTARIDSIILYFAPNVGDLEVDFLNKGGKPIVVGLDGKTKTLTLRLKGLEINALRLVWRGKIALRLNEIRIVPSGNSVPKWAIPVDPAANVSPSSP